MESELKNKKHIIFLNIAIIIILLIYGFIVIAPLFNMPMVRILKNYSGDLIHYLLRLAVLIFLIVCIVKCKVKVFKIIFSIMLLIFTNVFFIRLLADSMIHDEATLQKMDISKTESLESIYYPTEPGFIEIVYKKKIVGSLYCQKVIYSIDYKDKKIEEINIPLSEYYNEIKNENFGLCGFHLNYKNEVYADNE